MRKNKKLSDIISDNNLCISNNPYGMTRSWPNSFVQKFYNKLCNDIYVTNQSPNILEINQKNKLSLKSWELYFDNIKVDQEEMNDQTQNKIIFKKKYDLIIVNQYENIYKKRYYNKLLNLLKKDGLLIIENIYGKTIELLKLHFKLIFKYSLIIRDYRNNRFVKSNCILTIKKIDKFSSINSTKSIYNLIYFIIIENSIKFIKLWSNILKNLFNNL